MNAREHAIFTANQEDYDKLNTAYSDLMQAYRLNPKTKNLFETGGYNRAYNLLQRLWNRHHKLE